MSDLNILTDVTALTRELTLGIATGDTVNIMSDAGMGKTQTVQDYTAGPNCDWDASMIGNLKAHETNSVSAANIPACKEYPNIFEVPPIVWYLFGKQFSDAFVEGVPFPSKTDGTTKWLPDDLIGKIWKLYQADTRRRIIIILDEYPLIDEANLAYLYTLLEQKRLGRFPLPPTTSIVTLCNLETSGGINFVSDPMIQDRMRRSIYKGPTLRQWMQWNTERGLAHPWVYAGLETKPQMLYQFAADREVNLTHRSWTKALKALKAAPMILGRPLAPADVLPVIAPVVGFSGANLVQTAAEMASRCPSPGEIMQDPEYAPIPDTGDIGALIHLRTVLVEYIRTKKLAQVQRKALGKYLARFEPSALVHVLKQLCTADPALAELPPVVKQLDRIDKATRDALKPTKLGQGF